MILFGYPCSIYLFLLVVTLGFLINLQLTHSRNKLRFLLLTWALVLSTETCSPSPSNGHVSALSPFSHTSSRLLLNTPSSHIFSPPHFHISRVTPPSINSSELTITHLLHSNSNLTSWIAPPTLNLSTLTVSYVRLLLLPAPTILVST